MKDMERYGDAARARGFFHGKNSGEEEKVCRGRREGRAACGWEVRWTRYSNGIDGSRCRRGGSRRGKGTVSRGNWVYEVVGYTSGDIQVTKQVSQPATLARSWPESIHTRTHTHIFPAWAWQFRLLPRRVTWRACLWTELSIGRVPPDRLTFPRNEAAN